jgi:hypothetical protein
MENYLVVSYDSDQQKFFYDTVSAETDDAATEFILKLRPYCQDADATEAKMVELMAVRLKDEPMNEVEDVAECQNCAGRFPESQLDVIKKYSERVEPGEPAPAGECPECGALVQGI